MGNTMTPAQAARKLGVHVETVRRWIAGARLTAGSVTNMGTRENPRYRISRAEVERIERQGFDSFDDEGPPQAA